ncbi:MAG: hypothetical protein H8D87_13400 [Deltaproteobacteria bacterium]|uniref:hypothetical protein n=1 Tax=Desulfobacula sp. TaxID=2593537 RepID=UPI0019C719B9|nr:hypothetical protein [Candidatus Desulfobacula maris]MBL6992782.1 hypothetical protein [Desulfobacula sp.]
MIEPFFFEPNGALAFYHPSANPDSRHMLIICPPLFDEYQRTYKALVDLANACTSHPQGPHVLRIDYSGTGEAQGVLSDSTAINWLDDINNAIEEGIALTGSDNVDLMGVRFGAILAAQCHHSAVNRYIFWDPIDTGRIYLQWLDHVNSMLRSSQRRIAKEINGEFENIPYVLFGLSQKVKQGMEKLSITKILEQHPEKVWITTTNKKIYESRKYINCDFSGFEYGWPVFHQGDLIPKSVLKNIAQKVLDQ